MRERARVEAADDLRHEGRAGRRTCPPFFGGMEVAGEPVDRETAGTGRLCGKPSRSRWIAGRPCDHRIHDPPADSCWNGRIGVALVEPSIAPRFLESAGGALLAGLLMHLSPHTRDGRLDGVGLRLCLVRLL